MLRHGMTTCIGASYVGLLREPVPERLMEILQGLAEPQARTNGLDRGVNRR